MITKENLSDSAAKRSGSADSLKSQRVSQNSQRHDNNDNVSVCSRPSYRNDYETKSMITDNAIKDNNDLKFKPLRIEDKRAVPNPELQPFDQAKVVQEDLEQCLFIPQYDSSMQTEERQYKLYYGPLNVYMFMLYFSSIYERILKAQELVKSKVEQDFSDDFSRNEWSVKFQRKMKPLIEERFQYLIKAILTTMSHNNIMDANKYEDMARELLGNEAYLLFQVDKLANHCSKQLIHFQTDHGCKVSQKLFLEFEEHAVKKESQYLINFYEASNRSSVLTAGGQMGGRPNQGGG